MNKIIDNITIEKYDQINGTDVIHNVMNIISVYETEGVYSTQIFINWDDKVIVAKYNNEIVGAIVYVEIKWQKLINVTYGFVYNRFRKKGIYRKMWNELVGIAEKNNFNYIIGATGIKNEIMRTVMEKLNRKEFRIIYEYKVFKNE